MGKKGKRSGLGATGSGGPRGGGAPRPSPGLVVVNPMLLQSMANKASGTVKAAAKGKSAKPLHQDKKHKKSNADSGGNGKKRKGADAQSAKQKSNKKLRIDDAQTEEMDVVNAEDQASVFHLQVAREDHCLAALYWVLLTRTEMRSAVAALPNAHKTLTPPVLANALKSLGFQALSLHSKMTPGQRKQNVDRLVEQSKVSNVKFVLVVNDHWLNSASCGSADLVAYGTAFIGKSTVDTKFRSIIAVHADATVPAQAESYEKPLSNASLAQLQARLKIATQIATIMQKLHASSGASTEDAESKWAAKFSKGADLSDSDDDSSKKKKKGVALSPDEQRLRALTEKLLVLLARDVSDASSAGKTKQATPTADDAQHRAEKLQILGIVAMSAAIGASVGDGERLSAQTQWLDGASGSQFGGDWSGAIRHGASKDSTSLAVRQRVCECLSQKKKPPSSTHLQQWRPNQQPADVDAWGGAYGKACGHNEVVMQHLRPFFPQEVLNSRVCSKRQPAPGNQGFDGCLEFLRLACLDGGRCMTVWDAEQFIFISKTGRVSCTSKLQFLTLPLASLQTLMGNMRQWTLTCDGRISPVLLLEGIRLCCRLGAEDVTSAKLRDAKLVRRVLAYAIGGSSRVWKQITRMPSPIARDVVYEATT